MILMPIFRATKDENEQILKVIEENCELFLAWIKKENKEHLLEECWDNIQTLVNLMFMIAEQKEIMLAAAKHFEKMKNRKYEVEYLLKIIMD